MTRPTGPDTPHLEWTALPEDFEPYTFAAATDVVLVGGLDKRGAEPEPAVFELRIANDRAERVDYWQLPDELPGSTRAGETWRTAGPANVSAAAIDGRVLTTVMIRLSHDFAGSIGGWYHPMETDAWEYVASPSPDSDIDVSARMGIGRDVLTASESGEGEIFVVTRSDRAEDVKWPNYRTTRSFWRPSVVQVPDGLSTDDDAGPVDVSESGRWVALRVSNDPRMRDGVMVFERTGETWRVADRIDYPGYRVSSVAVTDRWIVILERNGQDSRLRWRKVGGGADDFIELEIPSVGLHVLGDRALITQGTRSLVFDLTTGHLTHNIQGQRPPGNYTLGGGRLAGDHAVFVTDDEVGVARLP
ncbi:MAG: hypothetical protein RIT81_00560 [Deltaproteobacteria bacterium]